MPVASMTSLAFVVGAASTLAMIPSLMNRLVSARPLGSIAVALLIRIDWDMIDDARLIARTYTGTKFNLPSFHSYNSRGRPVFNINNANRFVQREQTNWSKVITCFLGFAVLAMFSGGGCQAQESVPTTLEGWHRRVEQALKDGKADEALKEMDTAIKSLPNNSQLFSIRGSLKFRSGKIAESILDFDKCIELSPESKPYLWQRGIALYYAERFKDGLEQFAVHREVNPNDVENAFWHFLCNVRLNGLEASQKDVLLAGLDNRAPLMQVQKLIQGKLTPEDVIAASETGGAGSRGQKLSRFYGFLYVGLYYDAIKDTDKAKQWLEKCLEQEVDSYMADVAKIHLKLLTAKR